MFAAFIAVAFIVFAAFIATAIVFAAFIAVFTAAFIAVFFIATTFTLTKHAPPPRIGRGGCGVLIIMCVIVAGGCGGRLFHRAGVILLCFVVAVILHVLLSGCCQVVAAVFACCLHGINCQLLHRLLRSGISLCIHKCLRPVASAVRIGAIYL